MSDRDRARHGWYYYGFASHVFPVVVSAVFMSRYLTSLAENAVGKRGRLHVLGIPVAPGSLFTYLVAASTLGLVLILPLVGAVADRTGRKRDIMLGAGWFAAVCCLGIGFVSGANWQVGSLLYVGAFLGYSSSIVISYSLLVNLSAADQRDRVSSRSWAIAYLGSGSLLLIAFAASPFLSDSALARAAVCAAGLWWIGFGIPAQRALPRRIGSEARAGAGPVRLTAGFTQLAATLRHMRDYPLTLRFLIAFLVYNDGVQTVGAVASIYGDKQLHLSSTVLLLAILLVQFTGVGGTLLLGRWARTFGAKRIVLGCLVVWLVLVGAAFLLRPGVAWQFLLLAALIAVVLGGSQALSRSLFSRMIPVGAEAEYFAFYELSDSGTSWLGPLLFGLAYQHTGSYRSAILSLAVFFVVGIVLLARVPVRRAIHAAAVSPGRAAAAGAQG